jgi:hypothetical protein
MFDRWAEWQMLGEYFRKQYNTLFPPKTKGGKGKKGKKDKKGKKGKKDKSRPTYKVGAARAMRAHGQIWTASSERDIETAEAYIRGSFPSSQTGDHGEGDGDMVQLVKVPNKAKDWDRSLTPHVGHRIRAGLKEESMRCVGEEELARPR